MPTKIPSACCCGACNSQAQSFFSGTVELTGAMLTDCVSIGAPYRTEQSDEIVFVVAIIQADREERLHRILRNSVESPTSRFCHLLSLSTVEPTTVDHVARVGSARNRAPLPKRHPHPGGIHQWAGPCLLSIKRFASGRWPTRTTFPRPRQPNAARLLASTTSSPLGSDGVRRNDFLFGAEELKVDS